MSHDSTSFEHKILIWKNSRQSFGKREKFEKKIQKEKNNFEEQTNEKRLKIAT